MDLKTWPPQRPARPVLLAACAVGVIAIAALQTWPDGSGAAAHANTAANRQAPGSASAPSATARPEAGRPAARPLPADGPKPDAKMDVNTAARASLTVSLVQPQTAEMRQVLGASGGIAAWQEASIGAQAVGGQLAEVRVQVGDVVSRGQTLAVFATDVARADLAQMAAAEAEAESTLAEASTNAQRARDVQGSGALSAQQISQYLAAERNAQARLTAQRAAVKAQTLRLAQSTVVAPDDGVISQRNATPGSVVPVGQELFRMIRQARLEWRAEVPSTELTRLKPGQLAQLTLPDGSKVDGKLRLIAPTVDAATRNGLVYVDLPKGSGARPGMFARGEFALGSNPSMTLPQSAVQLRDGFSYVYTVGPDNRAREVKVGVGRRDGDRLEVISGLTAASRVVASGAGFLRDGDMVRLAPALASAGTGAGTVQP